MRVAYGFINVLLLTPTVHSAIVCVTQSQDSSVSIVTKLRDERSGFYFWQGQRLFCSPPLQTAQGPAQQWVPGTLRPRVKQPAREDDNSPPSSAEVKHAWRYIPLLYLLLAWHLVKHRVRLHGLVLN
jgi:hypothetical protein